MLVVVELLLVDDLSLKKVVLVYYKQVSVLLGEQVSEVVMYLVNVVLVH